MRLRQRLDEPSVNGILPVAGAEAAQAITALDDLPHLYVTQRRAPGLAFARAPVAVAT